MALNTEKYVRKPLFVDAVRITQKNFDDVAAWCQGEVQTDDTDGSNKRFIKVRVHNPKNPRQTRAYVGDWILYTERGYKVYTNKAFRASFDKAPPEPGGAPVGDAAAEEAVTTPPTPIESAELHSVGPVAEEPNQETGVQPILEVSEPQAEQPAEPGLQQAALESGHPIDPEEPVVATTQPPAGEEFTTSSTEVTQPVAAAPTPVPTPETPVEEVRLQTATGDDKEHKLKHEPVVPAEHEGKRVLKLDEQKHMTGAEIRGLLQQGDVVLEQDLVQS